MNLPSSPRPGVPSEQRLQLVLEAVVDYGIFLLDAQGFIVSWNTGAQKLKGWTADEAIGRHFSMFYPADAVARGWPQEELRLARQLGRFEDEGWRLRKDGSRFWANVVITALREDGGEVTGFLKITRDLTERRRHEEALRASEERMRLLVDSVRDYAIFMLDPEGYVQSWNRGAQALKGYAADEIIGRHFSTFYPPKDKEAGKPEAELAVARVNGRVEDEGWRVRKDGTMFWANVVLTAIHGNGGELLGFAKVTRDMTERRRLQELESSTRRIQEFLAMLAHELRNPLAPIRNAVSIMQLETLHSPVLRNCRDVIDRQLTHLTRLVDDLLDVGRMSTGKIQLRKELVRFGEIVMRGVETARPMIEARRHTLRLDLPAEPIYVQCDPTRITQVVQNLLVNAAKYTPDGGYITLSVQVDGNFVRTSVADNGRGIEASHLERIFELFMQADTGTALPSDGGLGIGLTLARSLVEMHGGSLEAASPGLGRGSTFTFQVPVHPEAAHAETLPLQEQSASALPVLVVDDNRDAADSATDILRLLGHRVERAYSGAEALALVQHFRPAVVMLDLAMPEMDGFETRRRLCEQPGLQHVFTIAMTGFGNEDDKRRTRAAGFDAHLTKPVDLDSLTRLLDEARTRFGLDAAGALSSG